MKQLPPDPRPGDKVTAEWARRISGCIRERTILRAPGYKVRTGPNGTSLDIERRAAAATAASGDLGCFRIVPGPIEEPEEGEEIPPTVHFDNRFLQYGNLTLTCDDAEITDEDYPAPEPGQDPQMVVALKASTTAWQRQPTVEIVTYGSMSEMQEDQHKLEYVIIPLYLFGANFTVQCDFRRQPMAPVGEVM